MSVPFVRHHGNTRRVVRWRDAGRGNAALTWTKRLKTEPFEDRERRGFALSVLDSPEQLMMYAQSCNDVRCSSFPPPPPRQMLVQQHLERGVADPGASRASQASVGASAPCSPASSPCPPRLPAAARVAAVAAVAGSRPVRAAARRSDRRGGRRREGSGWAERSAMLRRNELATYFGPSL